MQCVDWRPAPVCYSSNVAIAKASGGCPPIVQVGWFYLILGGLVIGIATKKK